VIKLHRGPSGPVPTFASLLARLIVPITLIVFAAPFFVLLFYAVPTTDDFCKATLSFNCVPQPDVLSITHLYYTQWSPRWLTTFLQSFVMSHVDLVAAYGWLLLAVIATNLASLWYFFRTFFRLTPRTSFLAAAVFYAAWVASLPHPEEEIFWLTGAMEYFLSLSTLLVLLSLLHRGYRSAWYFAAITLLSIAVPAQHEIAGTFLCVVLLAATVLMRIQKQSALQWYLSLGIATISQAVVMLSPGNRLRAAQEHRHLWDIARLPKWVAHAFYHGLDWLSYPSFLLAACCIILLLQSDQGTHAPGDAPPKWLSLAGLCAMIFILCEYSLVEMASGNWSPDRVVAWFAFVFCLLFVCVALTGIPEIFRVRFSESTRIGVFTIFAVTLLGSANFRSAVEDLSGTAQGWHRIDAAQLAKRGGSIEFELPARYPRLAMEQEVTSDPGCWVNRCLANYIHATTVIGKNSREQCPH
jgi:hypothetical protein